jgi:RNA polymerase sigma-70 factor (ECF subfamily)
MTHDSGIQAPVQTPAQSDDELLRRYANGRETAALGELVRRFSPIVYAAARRQLNDPTLADDVLQDVFITFARRAGGVRSGAAIGSWLLKTTQFTVANLMRTEARRRRHERAAAQQEVGPGSAPAALAPQEQWQAIKPFFDRAFSRLATADQTMLILRFLQGKKFGEIAAATGGNEDTVRKRAQRALKHLRNQLLHAGVDPSICGEAGLSVLLAAHAIEPVAAPLLTLTTTAAATAGGAAKTTVPFILGKLIAMSSTKKAITALVLAALAIGSVGLVVYIIEYLIEPQSHQIGVPVAAAPVVSKPQAIVDWHPAFYAMYRLPDGQPAKFLPNASTMSQRQLFYIESFGTRVATVVPYPDRLIFLAQRDGTVKSDGSIGPDMVWTTAQAILRNLRTWQIQGDRRLLNLRLTGDWVIQPNAAPDDVFAAMAKALTQRFHHNFAFKHENREVDAVIVTGPISADCAAIRLPFTLQQCRLVHAAHRDDQAIAQNAPIEWSGDIPAILDQVSIATGIPFVVDSWTETTRYHLQGDVMPPSTGEPRQDELLDKLRQQTGLTLVQTRQRADVWTLTER